jgi:hypothetical protein
VYVPAIKADLAAGNNIFKGATIRSIAARPFSTFPAQVDVGTFGVEYGLPLELGARAHKVPISRLAEWVRKKNNVANPWPLAVAIQKSISRRGTRAHPFMLNTFSKKRRRILLEYTTLMRAFLRT